MTKTDFLKFINKVETEFPVYDLIYKEIKIWPLIRLVLINMETQTKKSYALSEKMSLYNVSKHLVRNYRTVLKYYQGDEISLERKSEVLYFAKLDERKKEVEGRRFNVFGDSLSYLCQMVDIQKSFEIVELKNASFVDSEIYGSPTFINQHFKHLNIGKYLSAFHEKTFGKIFRKRISNWGAFIHYLNSIDVDFIFTEKALIERLNTIFRMKNVFKKIIRSRSAKAVILNFFAHDYAFALSLAGKELDINVVELQHGQQGDNNLVYSNWNNFPKAGVRMIPNYFWMWSEKNAQRIRSWLGNSTSHKVIIGGNPWLSYKLRQKPSTIKVLKNSNKFKKKVIISCQLELPYFVYDLIEKGQDILWLIRFHPLHLKYKEEIMQELDKKALPNIEIEEANSADLYHLYNEVDMQITLWSTVAYEALIFDVPTILIHQNGKDAMKEYIDQKIFNYSEDIDEILEMIYNKEKYFVKETTKYIEYDTKIIQQALNTVLNQ